MGIMCVFPQRACVEYVEAGDSVVGVRFLRAYHSFSHWFAAIKVFPGRISRFSGPLQLAADFCTLKNGIDLRPD
jgi:hypothetical protein